MSSENVNERRESSPSQPSTARKNTLKDASIVTNVISPNDVRKGNVGGLTVNCNELFLVRTDPTEGRIEVYNATNFTFLRYLAVNELGDETQGLASCDVNKCLYVSDRNNQVIHRIGLTNSNDVIKWKVNGLPHGLSVNDRQNVLVTCCGLWPHRLTEYSTRGERLVEIVLRDVAFGPRHAIQLTTDQFVVSHCYSQHKVCVIDASERELLSYGNERGSTAGQLNSPRHLAVDKSNGIIFAADERNDRVVLLDGLSLERSRYLNVSVNRPFALYFDEKHSHLLVGEGNGQNSRVLVVSLKSTIDVVIHEIAGSEDRRGQVSGLTVHGNELYVLRTDPTRARIEVHNASKFTFQRHIRLKELGEVAFGMTSCRMHNCLYVSDLSSQLIHRVALTGNNDVINWKVNGLPLGVSVNDQHNLLVSCQGQPHKLMEYTTRGQSRREISFNDIVIWPEHAIQLEANRFLVSYWGLSDSQHRVCMIDGYGKVIKSYGHKPGSATGQLDEPRRLAVDKIGGWLFVADCNNDRVVVLNSDSLTWSRDVKLSVKRPFALYTDEEHNRLFVGEWNQEKSRVVVVNF